MKHYLFLFGLLVWGGSEVYSQIPDFVYPPEFELHESVILTWDYNSNVDSTVANIVKAVQDHAKVQVIYYPGQVPYDTSYIRQYIIDQGASPDNFRMIPAWTETLWVRDYGPFVGYRKQADGQYEREVVDVRYSNYNRPNDDSVPEQLSDLWGLVKTDLDLDFEGGNILFDGLGRAFGSRRISWQNPQYSDEEVRQMIMETFDLYDFVYLEPLLNCGGGIWAHVDMWMKVIDQENILVSEYPDWVPDYNVIEGNVQTLASLTNALGKPYNIHRIPAPPNANGNLPITLNEEMRTYTNSLIMNDVVVVPSYGLELDQEARAIYEELFPGRVIKLVNASRLTVNYGAIHCITNEVPVSQFLRIIHSPIRGAINYSSTVEVAGDLQTDDPEASVLLYYRLDSSQDYATINLSVEEDLSFAGLVPGLTESDTVEYYLEAYLPDGTVRRHPDMGSAHPNRFWFTGPSGLQVIAADRSIQVFPNPATSFLNVYWDAPKEQVSGQLYATTGQLIWSWPGMDHPGQWILPEGLPAGVYWLQLRTSTGAQYQKIRVKR